jgi:hypothetical protein
MRLVTSAVVKPMLAGVNANMSLDRPAASGLTIANKTS